MDEARVVLERIGRIEALQREHAGAPALLAEVDRLVEEARAWLEVERGGGAAAAALGRVSGAVERARKAMISM